MKAPVAGGSTRIILDKLTIEQRTDARGVQTFRSKSCDFLQPNSDGLPLMLSLYLRAKPNSAPPRSAGPHQPRRCGASKRRVGGFG